MAISSIAEKNPEKVCHVDELKLLGMHNYENVMAAVANGGSVSRSDGDHP